MNDIFSFFYAKKLRQTASLLPVERLAEELDYREYKRKTGDPRDNKPFLEKLEWQSVLKARMSAANYLSNKLLLKPNR